MILLTVNSSRQLLYLSFIGAVRGEEVAAKRENLVELLNQLKPGFTVLSDLSSLESFDSKCAVEIGRNMELFNDRGVGLVVRVIPDSSKDFGLNIISFFHYAEPPRTVTCNTMLEAMKILSYEDVK